MFILKKLFIGLLVLLLPVILYGFAASSTAVMVFGEPDKLKRSLASSDAYETAADKIIKNQLQNAQITGISLDDPAVASAAKKALPPQTVQTFAEQIIDGTYTWLEGRASKPNFELDFSPVKQQFATNLGEVAEKRTAGLPACDLNQLRQLGSQTDVLNIKCLPPGLTATSAKQRISETVLNSSELADTTFTADDLISGQGSGATFEQLSTVPTIFQFIKILPWILGAIMLLLTLAVILLSESRRKGFHRIGVIFAVTGLILSISSLLARYFTGLTPFGDAVKNFSSLTYEIFRILLIFGVAYLAFGLLTVLILRIMRPKASS